MGCHLESCFIRALQIKGYHFRIFFLYSVPFPLSSTQLPRYIKSNGNVPGTGGMSDGSKEGVQLKCLLCLPKSALYAFSATLFTTPSHDL